MKSPGEGSPKATGILAMRGEKAENATGAASLLEGRTSEGLQIFSCVCCMPVAMELCRGRCLSKATRALMGLAIGVAAVMWRDDRKGNRCFQETASADARTLENAGRMEEATCRL